MSEPWNVLSIPRVQMAAGSGPECPCYCFCMCSIRWAWTEANTADYVTVQITMIRPQDP